MGDDFLSTRLTVLPFQAIHIVQGLVLRRGVNQVILEGTEAAGVLQTVVAALQNAGAVPSDVAALFAEPDRPRILELLKHLADRRFIVPVSARGAAGAPETNLDVLYWQFGQARETVARKLRDLALAFVGVNRLTHRMATAIATWGATNLEVVDDPLLRSVEFFEGPNGCAAEKWPQQLPVPQEVETWMRGQRGRVTCLVATSDFGGQQLLLPWNAFCVEHGVHFLPVTLQDLVGYIGPLVVPKETACLACLRARQNANLIQAEEKRIAEAYAHEGQQVMAAHPAMLSTLADIAAFELHRFYAGLPMWKVGRLIEVNLIGTSMTTRKVFKAPRCPVCSSLHDGVPTSLHKMVPVSAVMNR